MFQSTTIIREPSLEPS